MSQSLTLKLSDQVFTAIERQAKTIGISPERLATALLEEKVSQVLKLLLTEEEKAVARSRFERHFGAIPPSNAMNVDNESIDADLIAEYTSTHED